MAHTDYQENNNKSNLTLALNSQCRDIFSQSHVIIMYLVLVLFSLESSIVFVHKKLEISTRVGTIVDQSKNNEISWSSAWY